MSEFSNFFIPDQKIIIDKTEYLTVEHYYQSMKFENFEYSQIIKNSSTPEKASYLGKRDHKTIHVWQIELNEIIEKYKHIPLRKDWHSAKNNIMRKAVYQKFYQNKKLKQLLLTTSIEQINEHVKKDLSKKILHTILKEVRYLLAFNFPKAPTLTSNWVIPDILIASNDPSQQKDDIYKYLDSGIDIFVNLMEQKEMEETENKYHLKQYEKLLGIYFEPSNEFSYKSKENLIFIRFPILDRRTTSDKNANELSSMLCFEIAKGRRILVHCRGGKGRTGTICGIMLGKIYGMNYENILEVLKRSFESRIVKGKCPRFPQTKQQFEQIRRVIEQQNPSAVNLAVYSPISLPIDITVKHQNILEDVRKVSHMS